jgi:hypothetical protein
MHLQKQRHQLVTKHAAQRTMCCQQRRMLKAALVAVAIICQDMQQGCPNVLLLLLRFVSNSSTNPHCFIALTQGHHCIEAGLHWQSSLFNSKQATHMQGSLAWWQTILMHNSNVCFTH